MKKKKQTYLLQQKYLYNEKNKYFNLLITNSFKQNFEIPGQYRTCFHINIRNKEEWNSHKTLICPYTFSPRVPTKDFMFSRFYYVKYTTFLSNASLRQL